MAVSRLISVKDIESLVRQGMIYEQISGKLSMEHPASKALSSMRVWRFCKNNNIGRNCKLKKEDFMKEVFQCTSEINFVTVISIFEKINSAY